MRSADEARRWRTLASAAAAIAGGSEVVKMKPPGVAAHAVDHGGRPGDEAAERPVALGEAALHDRDVGRRTQGLRHAGALVSVRPGGVRLVQVGQRAVLDGECADLTERREVAVHRVDRLERDDARARAGSAESSSRR